MPPTDLADLLKRYAAHGAEEDFRAVVERSLPLVYSTALRQVGGNATLAEEVAQDVFIALAKKCTALGGEPTLVPWLLGATRLSAVTTLRREQRRLEREQKAYTMNQIEFGSGTVDWERTRPLLDTLIGQLSESRSTAAQSELRPGTARPFI